MVVFAFLVFLVSVPCRASALKLLGNPPAAPALSQRQLELGRQLERDERQSALLQQQLSELQEDLEQARREYSLEAVAQPLVQLSSQSSSAVPQVPLQYYAMQPAERPLEVSMPPTFGYATGGLLDSVVGSKPVGPPIMTRAPHMRAEDLASESTQPLSPLATSPAMTAANLPTLSSLLQRADVLSQGAVVPPRASQEEEQALASQRSLVGPANRQMPVTLPADATAGSVYSFLSPDGQRHAFQVPEGAEPGSAVSVAW